MRRKTKLVILGLIENKKHEFLLCQRYDPDVPAANMKWDLPGGTNEFGERLEDTVKREVLEETGLKIKVVQLLPKSTSRTWRHKRFVLHAVVLCYYCSLVSGRRHLGDHKIHDLAWVSRSALAKYDFLPTTQVFVDMMSKSVRLSA